MEKKTYRSLTNMKNRRNMFERKIKQYEDSIMLHNESILPFIQDQKGKYSKTKADKFMKEMISDIETAENFHYIQNVVTNDTEFRSDWQPYSEEESNCFFTKYLYCLMQICAVNPCKCIRDFTPNFDLIIRSIEHDFLSKDAFDMECVKYDLERSSYASMPGIFGMGLFIRYILTGERMSENVSEKFVDDHLDQLRSVPWSYNVWQSGGKGKAWKRSDAYTIKLGVERRDDNITESASRKEMESIIKLESEHPEEYLTNSFDQWNRNPYREEIIEEMKEEIVRIRSSFTEVEKNKFVKYIDEVTKTLTKIQDGVDVVYGELWVTDMKDTLTLAVDLFASKHFNPILLHDDAFFTSMSLIEIAQEKMIELYNDSDKKE